MTRIWIFSDLHLEAVPYPEAFQPRRPDFDVLVAAGDIWEGDCLRGFRFLRELANDKPIVFVMGNHEHWNGEVGENLLTAKALADDLGITFLDGNSAVISGCTFAGDTLWTDYSLARTEIDPLAETGEHIDIEHDGGTHLVTVGDAVRMHERQRANIETMISSADSKLPLVVVTHHAPHPDCVLEGLRGSWSAANSASDLSGLLDAGKVSVWIHGHVHHSVDMLLNSRTRILCNPAGPMFANTSFQESLVVEV